MDMKKYLIVYNPQSGNKAKQYIAKVTHQLENQNTDYHFFATTGSTQQDQSQLVNLVAQSSDVISIGGDGTLNLLCNVLANKKISLGIIPCGTGNDFARNFYHSNDDILSIVTGHKTMTVDLGWCNDRYFINVLGIGYDALVVKACNTNKKIYFRSLFYLWHALKYLPFYREETVELESKIFNKNEKTFLAAFGNGTFYGGGMNITPHADISDGLLDCCWVGKLSFYNKCKCLIKLFSGAHLNEKNIEYCQGKEFKIKSVNQPIEADGEFIGYSPAHIKIIQSALLLKIG